MISVVLWRIGRVNIKLMAGQWVVRMEIKEEMPEVERCEGVRVCVLAGTWGSLQSSQS